MLHGLATEQCAYRFCDTGPRCTRLVHAGEHSFPEDELQAFMRSRSSHRSDCVCWSCVVVFDLPCFGCDKPYSRHRVSHTDGSVAWCHDVAPGRYQPCVRCTSLVPVDGHAVQCERRHGHQHEHRNGEMAWELETHGGAAVRRCTDRPHPSNRCERPSGHAGLHREGEYSWIDVGGSASEDPRKLHSIETVEYVSGPSVLIALAKGRTVRSSPDGDVYRIENGRLHIQTGPSVWLEAVAMVDHFLTGRWVIG